MRKILSLIVSIMIAELIGLLSGFLTKDNMVIYKSLILPDFAPPGWIFAPVWIVLYLLMGIAAWFIWNQRLKNKKRVQKALFVYALNLFFNFFWTIIFFGFGLIGFALIELLILLTIIILTTIKFHKIKKVTLYLMIPYILWVGFAAVLNYSIWALN